MLQLTVTSGFKLRPAQPETATKGMAFAAAHGADLAGIGISCGGLLDPVLGIIQSPPNLSTWSEQSGLSDDGYGPGSRADLNERCIVAHPWLPERSVMCD